MGHAFTQLIANYVHIAINLSLATHRHIHTRAYCIRSAVGPAYIFDPHSLALILHFHN